MLRDVIFEFPGIRNYPARQQKRNIVRGAAFGPKTERRLRGQSSRFGERIDLTHEETCVGGGPGKDGAAGSSTDADVRSHVRIDKKRAVAPSQAPMGRRLRWGGKLKKSKEWPPTDGERDCPGIGGPSGPLAAAIR